MTGILKSFAFEQLLKESLTLTPNYEIFSMLPFEFVVIGKPVSHQNKVRKRVNDWKKQVRETAESN
ncbi:MAG: hypothetical protein AAF757_09710, partial [Cyanobacteria bacterium P01_D01_bin.116]